MSDKKILAAIADYRGDEHVFNEALKLAKTKGQPTKLFLLHVSPHEGVDDRAAREMLQLRADEAKALGIDAEPYIADGEPGNRFVQHTQAWEASYVVVGHRDRSSWNELSLGSVSNYVVQNVPKTASVLVVRPSIKILVAMENYEKDKSAFTQAKSLAKQLHASLILLHILSAQDEKTLEQGTNPIVIEGLGRMAQLMAEPGISTDLDYIPGDQPQPISVEELVLLAHKTTDEGIPAEFAYRPGGMGEGICDYARDRDVNLIVVGSHQHPRWDERVLGRVSQYVVDHAPCSVMVVHPSEKPEGTTTESVN
ncbi:MAG: universal stress protein [Leptolyngbyaceae cyanobacterium SL_7_1]|nr:universal stress protein [Leptolyngbyaceae cyanobacterium SL_7_1]